MPKPLPAFRVDIFKLFFNALRVRPPDNGSGNQDYDKYQSADAYNHLSPENPFISQIHTYPATSGASET